ncbi:MAG: hypothetical protein ACNA8H_00725 [Anaerolineales bacterium]
MSHQSKRFKSSKFVDRLIAFVLVLLVIGLVLTVGIIGLYLLGLV